MARLGRRRIFVATTLIVVAALLAACAGITSAYFSHVETAPDNLISFGSWGPAPAIYKVCPCFGISGLCSWAVFLYGKNLGRVSSIRLVKNGVSLQAKKLWHIGDCLLYCVFDLRGVPAGDHEIVAVTTTGLEKTVFKGFKVLGCGSGGGAAKYAATAETVPAVEDPLNFKIEPGRTGPVGLEAAIHGPVSSKFVSAFLVAEGIRLEGSVEAISASGFKVKFFSDGLKEGTYDLLVNRSDESSLLLEGSIVIAMAPDRDVRKIAITAVRVESWVDGPTVQLIVEGENLENCGRAALVCGNEVREAVRTAGADGSAMLCAFDLSRAPLGAYDLVVRGVDGSEAVLADCLSLTASKQDIPVSSAPDGASDAGEAERVAP